MFKGQIITGTTLTTDAIIPFTTVWNTNNNTKPIGNGAIELTTSGYYDVDVMATVTGVTVSPFAIQLYDGETPIAESLAETDVTATTGIHTVNINDTLRILPNMENSFAKLSVRVNGASTINAAVMTIEKRK